MNSIWLKEIERDLLALGIVIFYWLVIGRALIGPFPILLLHLLLSAAVLIILILIKKEIDTYLARAIILVISLSLHYDSLTFTIFASIIFLLITLSSYHLKKSLIKISIGFLFGIFHICPKR